MIDWILPKKSHIFAPVVKNNISKREPHGSLFSFFVMINRLRKGILIVEEKIVDLLDIKFKDPEFSDCFLIETKMGANKKLQVFIDSDGGISFSTCRRISRYLEEHIDAEGWLGEKYVLEVSSPGVDRPLQVFRQYPKNIGRKMEIQVRDEEKPRKGILRQVDTEKIVLEEEHTVKQGKKKVKEKVEVEIPFAEIEKAKVKISF